jgi:peptidoglycan/LPS O-acetylase OafA/YrhL
MSTFMLSAAILFAAMATIGWITPAPHRDAWRIGLFWLTLTLLFEFVAGHFLFRVPWREILGDYNVLRGRLWILVLIVTLIAPAAAAALKGTPS